MKTKILQWFTLEVGLTEFILTRETSIWAGMFVKECLDYVHQGWKTHLNVGGAIPQTAIF